MWAAAAAPGEKVFFALGNGDLVQKADKPAGALLCLEAGTGRRLWRHDVPDAVFGRPALDEKHVYLGSRDGHCYCLERATGRLCWKHNAGSAVVAAPALAGSRLYVVGSGGQLWCCATANGQVAWAFDLGKQSGKAPMVFAAPAMADEAGRRRLYLGAGLDNLTSSAATLYCLEEP